MAVTGCGTNKNNKEKLGFIDDKDHGVIEKVTYQFVGESEHLLFRTGKVAYNDNKAKLLISNFETKSNVKEKDSFIIKLSFHDKILYGNPEAIDNQGTYTKNDVQNIIIGDEAVLVNKKEEVLDALSGTTKDTFKKSIKMEAIFCRDNKCKTEEFKLTYVES